MHRAEARRTAFAVAAMLALALAGSGYGAPAAAAGGLVDGEYDCGGGAPFRAMGKVDIRDGRFRYRPYGTPVNGFAPYAVDGNGAITWGGPFGGLDEAPARITASTREAWGFNVKYQGSPDGLIRPMSCHAPGK